MISSRNIDDLIPVVMNLAKKHTALCKEAGIDLLIYCTYRDLESQAILYQQGRTKPGKVVTNARAGDSYHNYGCAYDCVPLIQGKPAWSDAEAYLKVGKLGESIGLVWAGRWIGSLKETAHFQYTGGLTIADLKAGKSIPTTALV
jgi:peptidoglycan L-alanyl-D-glutamate endopeptidase CwlK